MPRLLGRPATATWTWPPQAMAENIPGGGEWAVKDEETRSLSLIQATRWLETISYGGNAATRSV